MKSRYPIRMMIACCIAAALVCAESEPRASDLRPEVLVENVVTIYTAAGNGAGPLWCYGSPLVVRRDGDVFVSAIETGVDVPPLCNTRWQVWRGSAGEWKRVAQANAYREREPCPIGLLGDGTLVLSVNPSLEPPGKWYGRCRPEIVRFPPNGSLGAFATERPAWPSSPAPTFTDHSYRGLAVDAPRGEVLLLHIDAQTSAQHVSWRQPSGKWISRPAIVFPIRAAYPQVVLRNRAAHVLAIGDIVEPVEAWRKLKAENTGRKWDYVFRRLFYTSATDVEKTRFAKPIEIANVDATGGHIANLDLHVDATGAAHALYLEDPYADAHIRAAHFPAKRSVISLRYALIRDGAVERRATLAGGERGVGGIRPTWARFHVSPGERLHLIVAGTREGDGSLANYHAALGEAAADAETGVEFDRIPLKDPFVRFFTAAPRGGSSPSTTVDLFGRTSHGGSLRYARLELRPQPASPSAPTPQ